MLPVTLMIIGDYNVKPLALNAQVLLISTTKTKENCPSNHTIQQLYAGAISSQTKPSKSCREARSRKAPKNLIGNHSAVETVMAPNHREQVWTEQKACSVVSSSIMTAARKVSTCHELNTYLRMNHFALTRHREL